MYNGGIFCLHISNERYTLQLCIKTTAGQNSYFYPFLNGTKNIPKKLPTVITVLKTLGYKYVIYHINLGQRFKFFFSIWQDDYYIIDQALQKIVIMMGLSLSYYV